MMKSQTATVYVGLSGGVDSAVSAALLKERGLNVVGAFIKIWRPEFIECMWERDRMDAMRVAVHLNIPFREIDLSSEYKQQVIDEMVAGYERGETPNPDTLCNSAIKFGAFFDWARAEGSEYVATGHYARNENKKLLRGIDREKDQSYFLYLLTHKNLAHTLFPVGNMTKREVRRAAERFQLPVAKKPDSQGLCFVGDVSMRNFLSRYVEVKRGVVVDMGGQTVGEHDGAALYTIGQRHGFMHSGAGNVPHYIVAIDTTKNELRVSPRRTDAETTNITARAPNWISGGDDSVRAIAVQVRYRENPSPCKVSKTKEALILKLGEPRIAAPGQAAVFFDGEECLGGGIVHK